jgi:hypothetical protein
MYVDGPSFSVVYSLYLGEHRNKSFLVTETNGATPDLDVPRQVPVMASLRTALDLL